MIFITNMKLLLVLPGGDCYAGNSSCSGGSLCANNKCICPAGLVAKQGQCVASAMIG